MKTGLKERFIIIRQKTGLNTKQFATSLAMASTTVSSIESGKREPSKEVLVSLSTTYKVNLHWMLTGEGEMFLNTLPAKTERELVESGTSRKVALLRQRVSCGQGQNWENEENIKEYIDIFALVPRLKPERMFALCVQGTSMIGAGIQHGDYVLFNSDNDRYLVDGIYVFALDGDVYCKQLEFDKLSKKIKIYSVRVSDLEKAELLATLNIDDADFADRFHLFGKVLTWVHPNNER